MKLLRLVTLLIAGCLLSLSLSAQKQALYRTYAGQRIDRMLQLPDGGFLLAGLRSDVSRFFLLRTDAEGDSLWSRDYLPIPPGGPAAPLSVNMLSYAPGGAIYVGVSLLNAEIFPYILRFDGGGNILSQTYAGHQPVSKVLGMFPVADSSVVTVYNTFAAGPGYWIHRISPQGQTMSLSTFAFVDTFYFLTVCFNPYNNSLFWGGSSFYGNNSVDSFQNVIARTTLSGQMLWKSPFWPEEGFTYRQVIAPWGTGAVMMSSNPQRHNNGMHLAGYVVGPNGARIYQRVYDTTAVHWRLVTQVFNNYSPWVTGQEGNRAFVLKTDDNAYFDWLRHYFDLPGGQSAATGIQLGTYGNYFVCGHVNQDGFLMEINGDGDVFSQKISGSIYGDLNGDCTQNTGETGLAGFLVEATGRDGRKWVGTSQPNGHFSIAVPVDTFSLRIQPFSGDTGIWQACPYPATLILTQPNDTLELGPIGFRSRYNCPNMQVRLAAGLFRPCTEVSFQVNWCNLGNTAPQESIVALEIDPAFSYQSSTLPLLSSSGNQYLFRLDSAAPLTCGVFNVKFNLACSLSLGQTLCVNARIFPDTLCTPSLLWDGSDLDASATCQGDSVVFRLRNAGAGDMAGETGFIIIEDEVIMRQGPIQLPAGQDSVMVVPNANGRTYVLRVQQRPGKPGAPFAAAGVEVCGGNGNGALLQYALGNGDLSEFQYCAEVRTAFDPNDKQGFPLGYGANHWIDTNQRIQYRVRFQNTGNDTAFVVIIRDTLQAGLDPASFRFEGASHPCTCSMAGARVLKCVFSNVLLPDSTTNEPASHGFVAFSLKPEENLPNGFEVYNRAGIYFDFNPVVLTNQTLHTIGEAFIPVVLTAAPAAPEAGLAHISPNPGAGRLALWLPEDRNADRLELTIFGVNGREFGRYAINARPFLLDNPQWPGGMYLWQVAGTDGRILHRGKLVLR